jgi:hypothetical protein
VSSFPILDEVKRKLMSREVDEVAEKKAFWLVEIVSRMTLLDGKWQISVLEGSHWQFK